MTERPSGWPTIPGGVFFADFSAGTDGPAAGGAFGPGRRRDGEPAYPVHDQTQAIKNIKRKMSDLQKMTIEEQKKAVRAGYDMDIIPTDLATYGEEAKNLLQDLQSRNERMFLVTVLVENIASKRQKLFNDILSASGIAQKYNCALKRLDYQQEQGLMSSLALGLNQIEIERGLTTSSTAISCRLRPASCSRRARLFIMV